ncbi:hypothetical protein B0667_08865 [Lactiplantibacillus plantarum]|nr:hypothetical protein B0667_08865 [Lactiplantibacillus plantarum]
MESSPRGAGRARPNFFPDQENSKKILVFPRKVQGTPKDRPEIEGKTITINTGCKKPKAEDVHEAFFYPPRTHIGPQPGKTPLRAAQEASYVTASHQKLI